MSVYKGLLVPAPLNPEPLLKMGERVIHCTQADTDYIWAALKRDWLAGRGLVAPRGRDKASDFIRAEERKGYTAEYAKLEHNKDAQTEFVWHRAETRCRLPGRNYFVGRYILDYRYLYWPVHGRKFGYSFEALAGTKSRVFLLCQRDIYKTVMSGFVDPICTLGVRPWELIMVSGATAKATQELVSTIKDTIEGNERLMTLWPHLQPYYPRGEGKGKAQKWKSDELMISGYYDERWTGERQPRRRESSIMGISAEESPTRLHPTKWLFDDLINSTNSDSQPWLEQVIKFVREVMANLLQGQAPMGGSGTCWVGNDLAARISSGEIPGFKVIHLPIQDKEGNYTLPKEELDKQLSAAERTQPHTGFNDEIRDELKRTLTDYEYACQYECNPEARKMSAFDVENWKTFRSEGPHTPWAYIGGDPMEAYARWVEAMDLFLVMDLAVTMTRTADWTAMYLIGVDKKSRIWILDGVYDKMRPEYTYAAVAQLYTQATGDEYDFWLPRPVWDGSPRVPFGYAASAWRPRFIAMEPGLLSESFQAGLAQIEKERDFSVDWEKVKIQGIGKGKGKRDRIEKAIGRTWSQKRIRIREDIVKPSLYLPGGVINVTERLRSEYVGFDDPSNPDDGMDAVSLGAEWYLYDGEELPELPADEELMQKRRFTASVVGSMFRTPDSDEEASEHGLGSDGLIPLEDEDFDPFSIDWEPLRG